MTKRTHFQKRTPGAIPSHGVCSSGLDTGNPGDLPQGVSWAVDSPMNFLNMLGIYMLGIHV